MTTAACRDKDQKGGGRFGIRTRLFLPSEGVGRGKRRGGGISATRETLERTEAETLEKLVKF